MQHDLLAEKTCTHKNTCIFSSTCGNFWYHSCVLDFVVHFSPLLILHLQIVAFRLMNSAGCIWTDLTSSTSSTCPSLKKNTPQQKLSPTPGSGSSNPLEMNQKNNFSLVFFWWVNRFLVASMPSEGWEIVRKWGVPDSKSFTWG